MACRFCDKNRRIRRICGQCQEHFKLDALGRPDRGARILEHRELQADIDRSREFRTRWIVGGAVLIALILAMAVIASQPVRFYAHCQVQDWRELPDGLTWGNDVHMVPENANCAIEAAGPMYLLLGMQH